jgi:hypothetical protein
MSDEKLTPADASDIAESVAFALLFSGRKRIHDSDRLTASIAAQRVVRHLEKCGYVLMKRPPIGGSAPLSPPASWPHTKPEELKWTTETAELEAAVRAQDVLIAAAQGLLTRYLSKEVESAELIDDLMYEASTSNAWAWETASGALWSNL